MKLGQALSVFEAALPGGRRRPLPRGADQAAGGGPAAAGRDGPRGPGTRARTAVARAVPELRRRPGRRGQHRAGAPRGVVRRPDGRGEDPVPRRGSGPAVGPQAARPAGAAVRGVHPRAGRQAADRRAREAGRRGARLPARGRGAGGVLRGLRRRRGDQGPGGRHRHRARPRHRVDGGRPALPDHRRGHPRGARPRVAAAGPLPVLRTGPRRAAARRPAPRQLPPAAGRAARCHRLRGRRPPAGRRPRADRPARPAGAGRRRGRRPGRAAARGLRQGLGGRRCRRPCWTTCGRCSNPSRCTASASAARGCGPRRCALGDPRSPAAQLGRQLNLPPAYLLIHRVTMGTIGVLCQLAGEADYRTEMERWQPGFAGPAGNVPS